MPALAPTEPDTEQTPTKARKVGERVIPEASLASPSAHQESAVTWLWALRDPAQGPGQVPLVAGPELLVLPGGQTCFQMRTERRLSIGLRPQ